MSKHQLHFMLPDDRAARIAHLEQIIDEIQDMVAEERRRLTENEPNLFEENTNSTS